MTSIVLSDFSKQKLCSNAFPADDICVHSLMDLRENCLVVLSTNLTFRLRIENFRHLERHGLKFWRLATFVPSTARGSIVSTIEQEPVKTED